MFKKLFFVIVILFGLLIVAWRVDRTFFHPYIPDLAEQISDVINTTKFTIPKDKDSCEKAVGVWKKIGIRPVEECNLPTKDEGKECESSKVCEGMCIANLSREEISKGMRGKLIKTNGSCSPWVKKVGCFGIVYMGWASVVCVD